MKLNKPSVYSLANEVYNLSQANSLDKTLFQAKLDKLATVPGNNDEQRRMAVDMLCEFRAYKTLYDDNVSPHWVVETNNASPDLEYDKNGSPYPVEVKHVNPPRTEDIALSQGISVSGFVNPNYHCGVIQKVRDDITSAKNKFNTFNSNNSNKGNLYLYFSESIEAQVASYLPGSPTMQQKVETIVNNLIPSGMDVVVQDINSLFH